VAAGIEFIGIDQDESFGGTAARGGLGCSIAGSPLQARLGISDSPERAIRDLTADQTEADLDWARLYYRSASRWVYDWLVDLGVTFETVLPSEGDSVPRFHLPHGLGARVMALAWERFRTLGADRNWRFGLTVTGMLKQGRSVTGVHVRDRTGVSQDIHGNAVILATGGFAGNLEQLRDLAPKFADVPRLLAGGGPSAQGSGHELAAQAGGYLTHLHNVYGYANGTPDYTDPSGRRGVVVRNGTDWIWINCHGQRFLNEDLTQAGRTATSHLLQQDGATCWAIFDDRVLNDLTVFDHYQQPGREDRRHTARRYLRYSPYARTASSCAALASCIGLAPEKLEDTIAGWHRLIASGASQDLLTGRSLTRIRPLGEGDWHAIQLFPLGRKTLGGVRTDLDCRVISNAGERIPGLYAAGELAGFGGGHLSGANSLEGLMAGGSLFSGRVAGRAAIVDAAMRGAASTELDPSRQVARGIDARDP